jgi:hypothetical protein
MLLLFPPLFIANLVAALIPVKRWPPDGRRFLLLIDTFMTIALFIGAHKPATYSEWGMGDLHQTVCPIAGTLLCLSALPLAKQCFVRPRS